MGEILFSKLTISGFANQDELNCFVQQNQGANGEALSLSRALPVPAHLLADRKAYEDYCRVLWGCRWIAGIHDRENIQVEKLDDEVRYAFRSNWWIPDGWLFQVSSTNQLLRFRLSVVGPVGYEIESEVWTFHNGQMTRDLYDGRTVFESYSVDYRDMSNVTHSHWRAAQGCRENPAS